MVQIIPPRVEKLWNEWDVRFMILLSLFLQIVLIFLGSRRKYSNKSWVRIIIWMSYLSADWVATVTLGMIATFETDRRPFLLAHLGGPGNITAYSLEDNELWLRHLLGLIVQVAVALYIFLRSWTEKTYQLSLLAVQVFVVGIIKYGERSWALFAASRRPKDKLKSVQYYPLHESYANSLPGATHLHQASKMFTILKKIYAGEIIMAGSDFEYCTQVTARQVQSQDALKLTEIELEYLYDVLYTKASIVYTLTGVILQSISLLCYVSTLLIFCFLINKKPYATADVAITYLLCAGAVSLELCAIFVLFSNNWTLHWLSRQTHPLARVIYRTSSTIRSKWRHQRRWSESMGQFNLMEFCLKASSRRSGLYKRFPLSLITEIYTKYQHTSYCKEIPSKMIQLILEQVLRAYLVQGRLENMTKSEIISYILSWRGIHALEESNCHDEDIKRYCSATKVPFEKSIMVWHIASDICYWNDVEKHPDGEASDPNSKSKVSKLLSDYLMYILVMCPNMLLKGNGQVSFGETCLTAKNLFRENKEILCSKDSLTGKSASQVMYELRKHMTRSRLTDTVLLEGCALAHRLQDQEIGGRWDMISRVWIEMLFYAATQCDWKQHAHQLRRGGELLTHVCLLMVNSGYTEQVHHYESMKGEVESFLETVRVAP